MPPLRHSTAPGRPASPVSRPIRERHDDRSPRDRHVHKVVTGQADSLATIAEPSAYADAPRRVFGNHGIIRPLMPRVSTIAITFPGSFV
jgi:hypothetical protein